MYESMNVQHVLVRSAGGRQLDMFVMLVHPAFKKRENFTEAEDALFKDVDDRDIPDSIDAHALIDSGCTGSCIDSGFVKNCSIPTTQYIWPQPVYNADGMSNDASLITDYVELEMYIGGHLE